MGFLELSLHSQHCHNGICSRKIPSSLRESVALNVGLLKSSRSFGIKLLFFNIRLNRSVFSLCFTGNKQQQCLHDSNIQKI